MIKYFLKIIIVILLITIVGLSGCNEQIIQDNEESEDENSDVEGNGENNTAVLNISGTIDTSDGNIKITLSGDYITIDNVDISIKFNNTLLGVVTLPISGFTPHFSDGSHFRWTDINEDGNVGNTDLIELYHDDGLAAGEWLIKIKHKSTGEIVYDSGAIEIL